MRGGLRNMKVRLRDRDLAIIGFLNKGLVATTEQINHLFFETEMSHRRRLLQLTKAKKIKRYRLDGNHSCVYYVDTLPKDFRKRLFWTKILICLDDYMVELNNQLGNPTAYGLLHFEVEKQILFFKCDLFVILKTPKGNVLLMIQAAPRGSFDGKPFRRLQKHYLNEFRTFIQTLRLEFDGNLVPISLQHIRIVSCFPKDEDPLNHIVLHPNKLKNDLHLIFDSF